MKTTRSSSATSCCEFEVLNRQLEAGENRDGCADRRRESPSTHLIERRIELKVCIVIIISTQISHFLIAQINFTLSIITSAFKHQWSFVIQVEVLELATIYSNQQEIDTRMVAFYGTMYIHRATAFAWLQEHSSQNH